MPARREILSTHRPPKPLLHTEGRLQQGHCARDAGALRQTGTSLAEFAVVAVPILLLGMGSIETAQWFLTRQAVSLALLEAARAASTGHLRPELTIAAFERALLPLFPANANLGSNDRLQAALNERHALVAGAPWQMQILSPTPQAFDDFADTSHSVARQFAPAAINNNYQFEQHQRHIAQGWGEGLGPRSGMSIYQANTATLRLHYLHEPVLPGMKGLMRMLGNPTGTYGQRAMALGGYLPLNLQISVVMQSHPVDWPVHPSGKIIKQESHSPKPTAAQGRCHGLWCLPQSQPSLAGPDTMPQPPTITPSIPTVDSLAGSGTDAPTPPPIDTSGVDGTGVLPDDPACGLTLCCVGG